MPLVWAHAEHIKLRRSLRDGHVFDLPPQTVRRYLVDKTVSPLMVWRFNHKLRSMPAGKSLRVETLTPAIIHYSVDDWKTSQDAKSRDVGLGIHVADLVTQSLADGQEIKFTFYWPAADHWEGTDFVVRIGSL
jgi:glucoamylase